jgi:hypothetical protein
MSLVLIRLIPEVSALISMMIKAKVSLAKGKSFRLKEVEVWSQGPAYDPLPKGWRTIIFMHDYTKHPEAKLLTVHFEATPSGRIKNLRIEAEDEYWHSLEKMTWWLMFFQRQNRSYGENRVVTFNEVKQKMELISAS